MSNTGDQKRLDDFLRERYLEQRAIVEARNTFPLRSFFSIFSPNWLLMDIDSKLKILLEHVNTLESEWRPEKNDHLIAIEYYDCDVCCGSSRYIDQGGWCFTLRAMAAPYIQHKDYQTNWKP